MDIHKQMMARTKHYLQKWPIQLDLTMDCPLLIPDLCQHKCTYAVLTSSHTLHSFCFSVFPCCCIAELTHPEMTYFHSIAWEILCCEATQGLLSGDKTWIALQENGCLRIINKCIWGKFLVLLNGMFSPRNYANGTSVTHSMHVCLATGILLKVKMIILSPADPIRCSSDKVGVGE